MNDEPLAWVKRKVKSWPGVTTGDTGRGGLQFSYGRVELGHLHGSSFADLPFPKKVRDELIAQGRASVRRATTAPENHRTSRGGDGVPGSGPFSSPWPLPTPQQPQAIASGTLVGPSDAQSRPRANASSSERAMVTACGVFAAQRSYSSREGRALS